MSDNSLFQKVQRERDEARAAHAETREAWLKQGEELIHWQERAQRQDAEIERLRAELRGADDEIKHQESERRQAEARLAKVVEALRDVRGRAVAGLTHESISARERCHAIKERCDAALAAAQPEEPASPSYVYKPWPEEKP